MNQKFRFYVEDCTGNITVVIDDTMSGIIYKHRQARDNKLNKFVTAVICYSE